MRKVFTMHTTEVGVNNVPAFLVKLWKLVEDEKCNNLISWSSSGQSFIIHNQTQFAKELLPLYFKHNNMASFIRQLNMYGFRKVTNIDQGLRSDREEIEFFHNFFIRGQECLLEFIKRKVPSGRGSGGAVAPEEGRARAEVLRELLSDVGSIQGRQEHMDQLLADMKKENEALWREVARLRQKHIKQQQIVEKLIQFLVTMVQANRNITVKRKMPLMLHDSPSSAKVPRLAKAYVTDYQVSSPAGSTLSEGPVIRDVTDLIEDVGEASSTVIGEPVATSPRAVEVSGPAPTPPSDDIEAAPMVASPLSTGGRMEPLCLFEPLQDGESGTYVLPCDIEEVVVDSSESSPKEAAAASSQDLGTSTTKALQVVTPAVSAGKRTTARANSTSSAKTVVEPALVGEKPLANGAPDLLSSCVMLEGIPMFSGDTDSSPCGRDSPSPVVDEDTGCKDVATPASPGMQVALQDKPSGPTRVFADHIESIDSDLDWLQDQLMSGGLNLDTSTLMGVCPDWTGLLSGASKLFSPEDHLTSCLGDLATENRCSSDAIGNELVQYTPSLLDLGIEEDPSFQPVNELLLSDDELPSSSSTANGDSVSKPSSERGLSVRSPSPCLLYTDAVKPVVQTVPRLVAKRGTTCGKKRRGTSRK